MNTTTLRAAAARVYAAFALIDWQEVAGVVTDGLRTLWAVAQTLAAVLVILWQVAYEHRQQIRSAAVIAAAAVVVAAEVTYGAGRWTRRQLLALGDHSAALVASQPLPAVAPITATLAAAREALARLIARLYPVVA